MARRRRKLVAFLHCAEENVAAALWRVWREHNNSASGVAKDEAAVRAAISLPWSNGQTEGQITKLKLVKRQMYGRAKIDLLQARLIGAI
jgi:transposase